MSTAVLETPTLVRFWVPGIAAPGGSKRAFNHAKTGKVIVLDDCRRNRSWMNTVSDYASQAYRGPLLGGPLKMGLAFYFTRPKGHYRTGKRSHLIRDSAPSYPAVKPDLTKLIRSTEDALKSVIFKDDAQIVIQVATKGYAERPGVWVTLTEARAADDLT